MALQQKYTIKIRQVTIYIENLKKMLIIYMFRSLSELNQVNMLSNKIDSFFKSEKATPEQVQGVAYECLNATMTMDTSQVQNLAEEINKAIGRKPHTYFGLSKHNTYHLKIPFLFRIRD